MVLIFTADRDGLKSDGVNHMLNRGYKSASLVAVLGLHYNNLPAFSDIPSAEYAFGDGEYKFGELYIFIKGGTAVINTNDNVLTFDNNLIHPATKEHYNWKV
jgi:hypothetical protein